MLNVNQGPYMCVGHAFRFDLQLLASHGIGVVYSNFVYLLGTRNFCSPGSTINTNGNTRVACTSPAGSPLSTKFNAYVGSFTVRYVTGPWLLQAKYAYASGNRAGRGG